MTTKPNGTDAKDIALHFIKVTTDRTTPSIIARTIIQAKSLLSSGYSKDEIIDVINYIATKKSVDMYSLGYVSASINSMLKEMEQETSKQQADKLKQQIQTSFAEVPIKEVTHDCESTERNRTKSERLGVKSRIGTQPYLDLFKE